MDTGSVPPPSAPTQIKNNTCLMALKASVNDHVPYFTESMSASLSPCTNPTDNTHTVIAPLTLDYLQSVSKFSAPPKVTILKNRQESWAPLPPVPLVPRATPCTYPLSREHSNFGQGQTSVVPRPMTHSTSPLCSIAQRFLLKASTTESPDLPFTIGYSLAANFEVGIPPQLHLKSKSSISTHSIFAVNMPSPFEDSIWVHPFL